MTTTDVLKAVGLVLVALDHWGLYFDEAVDAWRVAGRLAAPVFFFLVGLAGGRRPPAAWIVLGLGLWAVEMILEGEATPANILLNFALVRLLLLALPERWAASLPGALGLAVATTALVPVVDPVLEYGAEGWLWALAGLAARGQLTGGGDARPRIALTAAAAIAYGVYEAISYEFDLPHVVALAVLIGLLSFALLRFRRADLARPPAAPLAAVLRFAGARSLELYALNLFLSEVIAHALADE